MIKNSFFKTIPFLLFIVLLNSCDKEFNVIGDELIEDSSFKLEKIESSVVAYNQKIDVVQSNNLSVNALGIYDDPSFGTTRANFATQLILASTNPTIGSTAVIKSVVLTIPYFYDKTQTVTKEDGSHTYVLDSIYGPTNAKIKLSVYESGYYMRNLDPADQFLSAQKYYNNQNPDFDQAKIGSRLNDSITDNGSQNDQFFFDPAEHSVETTDSNGTKTVKRTPPEMHLNLNKMFFKTKIMQAPAGSLTSNDSFKDYFRGLYFSAETSGSSPSALGMINFKAGQITILYTETVDAKPVEKSIVINMAGSAGIPVNTVSLLNKSNVNTTYTSATDPANVSTTVGDDNLFVKGGEGSMAILDLFGPDNFGSDGLSGASNGVPDELDVMRSKKYLINEANLVFNVNTAAMGTSSIAQRLYLYDYTNSKILPDYFDKSTNAANPKNSKLFYGGIITKGATAGDLFYKFRITEYIRQLVKNSDLKNAKLGVVVTEDINMTNFYSLLGPNAIPAQVPIASVMNPLGVILYGGNATVAADKRLKLVIYYTKPN